MLADHFIDFVIQFITVLKMIRIAISLRDLPLESSDDHIHMFLLMSGIFLQNQTILESK